MKRLEMILVEKIKKTEGKDKEVVKEMENTRVKILRGNEWEIEGDLILKKRKIYMLKNKELTLEVI